MQKVITLDQFSAFNGQIKNEQIQEIFVWYFVSLCSPTWETQNQSYISKQKKMHSNLWDTQSSVYIFPGPSISHRKPFPQRVL